MVTHSIIRKGSEHKVFCEDFVFHQENERFISAAILDGCSTGTESHFASALYGKAIKSNVNIFGYVATVGNLREIEDITKQILYASLCQVNTIRAALRLGIGELLATIIFSLYDKKSKELFIIVIGDGVFVVNGQETIIDQNNMPDYISYHIESLVNRENFNKWFETFPNKFRFEGVNDYSICSDGILSFKVNKPTPEGERDPIEFFTKDNFLIKNPSMLGRKCNILEMKHGMMPQDDLSIIRVYNEPELTEVPIRENGE